MTLIPTFFGDNEFGDDLFGGAFAGEGSMVPALPDYDWDIAVRNPDGSIEGALEVTSAELHPLFNDIGPWAVNYKWDGDLESPAGKLFVPGSGLVFSVNGVQIMSGPWTKPVRTRDGDDKTASVGGVDDMQILADRWAVPEPETPAPPYVIRAKDVQGPDAAETVIKYFVNAHAGPGALVDRREPRFSIESDLARGADVKGVGQWQNLLELVQQLAIVGGVGFRVVPVSGGRQFQVYVPEDKSDDVVFGVELGNVSTYSYDVQRPAANYEYILGAGTGTTRVVQEGSDAASIAAFGRIESVIDGGDSSDATVLGNQIAADLASKAAQYSIAVAALDTAAHQWKPVALPDADTYDLGDKVTVAIEGVDSAEVLREVAIGYDDAGTRIVPMIGTPGSGHPAQRFFRMLLAKAKSQEREIRALQGRGTT